MKNSVAVFAALLTLPGVVASASEAPLTPGALVRVTTTGGNGLKGTFEGRLARIDADAVVLADREHDAVMTIARPSVTRVQVATPHRQTLKGLLRGGAAGLALGAFTGSVDDGSGCGLNPKVYEPCSAKTAAQWAAQGAASGAVIGAAIGFFCRGHQWRDTAWDGVRVSIAPLPGRGVAFSVSSGGR